ncbi:MAG: hypothetical protein JW894_09980 [Bacteroidales bacterium]|nr:hypothetical protein [Bacteroidales bacterium]
MMRKKFTYICLVICLLCISCLDDYYKVKDDLSGDNDVIFYNPTYSLPVGQLSYSLNELLRYNQDFLDLLPFDYIVIPPTDTIIEFNGEIYRFPYTYDTIYFDTIDFSALIKDSEYIVSLMFRTRCTNKLPVEVGIQVSFCNDEGDVLDSLFSEGILWLPKAEADQNGIIPSNYGPEDIYIEEPMINTMISSTVLETHLYLRRDRNEEMIIYLHEDYGIDVQLAVRVELLVPIN